VQQLGFWVEGRSEKTPIHDGLQCVLEGGCQTDNLGHSTGVYTQWANNHTEVATYLNLERQFLSGISPTQTTAQGQSTAIERSDTAINSSYVDSIRY
jgi:hypothetical protein